MWNTVLQGKLYPLVTATSSSGRFWIVLHSSCNFGPASLRMAFEISREDRFRSLLVVLTMTSHWNIGCRDLWELFQNLLKPKRKNWIETVVTIPEIVRTIKTLYLYSSDC